MSRSWLITSASIQIKRKTKLILSRMQLYLLQKVYSNKGYVETTFRFEVCFNARRFCRIFDNALLAVMLRLAAEEVGKTWLGTRQCVSLGDMMKNEDHTDSTISKVRQLLLTRRGLLRGRGGYDKTFPSLWSCRSLRTLKMRLERIGPTINVKISYIQKSIVLDEPGLQRKQWMRWWQSSCHEDERFRIA